MKKFLLALFILTAAIGISSAGASSPTVPSPAATLYLPSGLTKIANDAFHNDTKIEAVVIDENVTEIGAGAFSGCSSLRFVTFKNADTVILDPETSSGRAAFAGCDASLIFVAKSGGNVEAYAKRKGIKVSKLRAVLIGQNYLNWEDTEHPEFVLSGCIEDASYMSQMLSMMTGTAFETYMDTDASEERIRSILSTHFADSETGTPYDVSLFYFSGHGTESGNLVCTDFLTGGSMPNSKNGQLSGSELRTLLDKVPGKKIVIVDSCYSGSLIGKGEESSADKFAEGFISAFSGSELLSRSGELRNSNYAVIAACSQDQQSFSLYNDEIWYGAMTRWLMSGIGYDRLGKVNNTYSCTKLPRAYADSNGDGKLTLAELSNYIPAKVSRELQQLDTDQTVVTWSEDPSEVLFVP